MATRLLCALKGTLCAAAQKHKQLRHATGAMCKDQRHERLRHVGLGGASMQYLFLT
ncbi:hypothetical protein ACRRTK_019426 [Alexandromys fortis]